MLKLLFSGFVADCRDYAPQVAALRLARGARVMTMGDTRASLTMSDSLRRHVAAVAPHDGVFYLSHRHYLARGLGVRARVDAALAHYQHEDTGFDAGYRDEVYAGDGLVLWHREVAGVAYDIRLMPGNDVLNEGGLSVVLHVGGARVGVLSYSMVPAEIVAPDLDVAPRRTVPFVTRKQMAADRGYQASFAAAFDRVMPAHLLLGALTGVALAQGHRHVAAISAERHPALSPERRDRLTAAYDDVWTQLSGYRASPVAYIIDIPLQMPPLDRLDAARRRRALARRAHVEAACRDAEAAVVPHLVRG